MEKGFELPKAPRMMENEEDFNETIFKVVKKMKLVSRGWTNYWLRKRKVVKHLKSIMKSKVFEPMILL